MELGLQSPEEIKESYRKILREKAEKDKIREERWKQQDQAPGTKILKKEKIETEERYGLFETIIGGLKRVFA